MHARSPGAGRPRFRWLLAALLLASCGGEASETAAPADAPEQKGVIGVSVLTLTNPFFQDLTTALRQEAARQGFEVVLTSGEFDVARQREQVSDFVVRGVDAIVLSPCDSQGIAAALAEANRAGIPVFTADIAALADSVTVVSHVATDNFTGGRLAAEAVLEAIGGVGQIAVIDHPEVESAVMRTRGFRARIEEAARGGAAVEIVDRRTGGGIGERALQVAAELLRAHPELDAVFAINDAMALATVEAVEQANRAGRVKIVGFDGMPEARRAIRDGRIYADVLQHPGEIGRRTIEAVAAHLAGEAVAPQLLIPASLYGRREALQDSMLQADSR